MAKTQEIGDIFTAEGLAKLKVGQLLRFDYEGSLNELIITKINKKSHKCYARTVRTYHPDEVQVVDKDGKELA